MKLKFRLMDGGPSAALHTEDGVILPQQLDARLESVPGDRPVLVVRFHIDGDQVDFEKSS